MSVAVLLTGLPATGKSTLAAVLAQALPAVLVPHDWISAALRSSGLLENFYQLDIDRALGPGYTVATHVALANLRVGHHVVIDSLLHSAVARHRIIDQIMPAAGRVIQVWCTASNPLQHRRAVENRERGIPGWGEVSWAHVERVKVFYEPPEQADITVDLGTPITQSTSAILALCGFPVTE